MTQHAPSETTGDAVLQAAIQMEDAGRDFYEAFALAATDPKVRDLCMKLAVAESNHRKVFQQMRSELARQGRTVLLRDEQLAEARRSAKGAVLPPPETVREMVLRGDARALLDLAAQVEEDAIRFFRGFLHSVPDRSVLEGIIREEQEHLRLLRAAGAGETGG